MDEYMTFEDAENQAMDEEMARLVEEGIINPKPVFDIISFNRVFNGERETEEQIDRMNEKELAYYFETPAYARRVEELI